MSEERELVECDGDSGMLLLELLEGMEGIERIGKHFRCSYCGDKITKETFGGLFSKPNKILCRSTLCMTRYFMEEEEEDGSSNKS